MHDGPADPPIRDEAASDLRHELGNRLASIVAFSHLIRTDPRLPADLRDQADLLAQEADRTRRLVDQLLETPPVARARSDPGRAAGESPDPAFGATAPARILIVDDEPAIRDFLGRIVRGLGHQPVLAATGTAALELVSAEPPDAILCDHRMAGMSGAEFNAAVGEISPPLARRFAFMTGDAADAELRAVADARGAILLAKPFDVDAVARTLETILPTDGGT